MRMFLLPFLLFTPLIAYAESCIGLNQTTCTNTGGCYWNANENKCQSCPAGSYCPSSNEEIKCNNGSGLCDCPAPFTQSDPDNNNEISTCYAKVFCDNEEVKVYCKSFENENNCNFDEDSGYIVQGFYDANITYYNNELPKISYQQYAYLMFSSDIIDDTDPNLYHIELQPHYTAPRNIVPDQSWQPTSYTLLCVKNQTPCSFFRHDPSSYNDDDFDSISSTLGATNCPVTNTVSGDAAWVPKDENNDDSFGHWDVSQCECNMGNNEWITINEKNCEVKGQKIRTPNDDNSPINNVHSIYENIIFNPTDVPENTSSPKCRRCLQDTADTRYYVNDAHIYNGYVIQCTPVNNNSNPAKGYYRTHQCGGANVDWGSNLLPQNPCPRHPCPAGQTTDDFIPIGIENCKYTNNTIFCDAKGCFNIDDILYWSY